MSINEKLLEILYSEFTIYMAAIAMRNLKITKKPAVSFVINMFSGSYTRLYAALAYYFLVAFFPLILFVSLLLSAVSEGGEAVKLVSEHMIPSDIINTVSELLEYTSSLGRSTLMYSGAVMSLYGGSRAVSCLIAAINKSYELEENRGFLKRTVINFGFSAFFMISISAAVAVAAATPGILAYVSASFGIDGKIVHIWSYMRFVIILLLFFFLLLMLYSIAPACKIKLRQALPGAAAAAVGWVAVSMFLSFYVDNMAGYSLLYGSIGAVIVLMLWLYFTAMVLIAGAKVNRYIMKSGKYPKTEGL